MPHKIVIVGTGNVAFHLGKTFLKAGQEVLQIAGRSQAKAETLAGELGSAHTSDFSRIDPEAEVIILAVKDDVIEEVAARIDPGVRAVVAHCAGSLPMSLLSKFKKYGVFYPLQTMSRGKNTEGAALPVCIEASTPAAEKTLKELGRSIGDKVMVLDSAQRLKLHVAAVFVSNFVNHLYRLAFDLLKKEHISEEMLRPLLHETAMKAMHNNPSAVQTGPAARHDMDTIGRHLELLLAYPGHREVYELLSNGIMNAAKEKNH